MSTPKRLHIGMSLAPPGSAAMPGGAPTAISKASSAAISPSTSPGAPKPPTSTSCFARTSAACHWTCWRPAPASPAWIPPYCLPRSPAKPRGSAWCRRSPPRSIRPTWWPGSCNRCTGSATAAPAGTSSPRCRATRTSAWTRCPMRSSATRAPPSSPGWCTTCGTASPRGTPGRPRERPLRRRFRVHPVDHDGEFLKVKGPLNLPAFGEARIPLVQAGASESGRDFAASVADLVFAPTPDKEAALELRRDLSRRAERHGRSPRDVRLLPGFSLYLAESREEAREIFMQTHARLDRTRKFATIRQMLGLDLSDWPLDRPISAADLPPPVANPGSRTHTDLLRRLIERETLRLDQLLLRPRWFPRRTGRSSVRWTMPSSRSSTGPPPAPWTVSSPRREARSARCGCSSNRWCRAWWKRGCSASATAPLPSPGTWQRNDGKGRRRPRPGGDGERVTACGLAA